MNINRKEIKINLNDENFSMVLDFESAILYQELSGESIFVGVERIGKEMDIKCFAYLIASTLRTEEGKLVGMDFVKKLDLVFSMEFFMNKLGELLENSLPANDEADIKKKKA